MARRAPLIVLVVAFAALAATQATEVLLDDLEGPNALTPWSFFNGPEFPGATGSIRLDAGNDGAALELRYDFTGGGNYVTANRGVSPARAVVGVSYDLRAPPDVEMLLRVRDNTSQTLAYNIGRPLWASDPNAWYRYRVLVDFPNDWWNGSGTPGKPTGGLALVQVLADPLETAAERQGSALIDNVRWIDALSLELEPLAPAIAPLHRPIAPAVSVPLDVSAATLDKLAAAGFHAVRAELPWATVEPSAGTYDFSTVDPLAAALSSRGLGLIAVLGFTHPTHSDGAGAPPRSSATRQAFGQYAAALAQRLAGSDVRYQLWNDAHDNWSPSANGAEFGALFKEVVTQVRAKDSAAIVAAPMSLELPFLRAVLAAQIPAGGAVALFPSLRTPERSVLERLAVKAELARAGVAFPVWHGGREISSADFGDGQSTGARELQAYRVARDLLSSWAAGDELFVYPTLVDTGTNGAQQSQNTGLLTAGQSDKPAFVALQTLAAAAKGRRNATALDVGVGGVHAVRIEGDDDVLVALWGEARGLDVSVTVPTPSQATDVLGRPAALTPQGGQWTVRLRDTTSPVLLVYPGQVAPPPDGGEPGEEEPPPSPGGGDGRFDVGLLGWSCGCGAASGSAPIGLGLLLLLLAARRARVRARRP